MFWLARYEGQVRYVQYYARFSGSVSQLRVDSTVLFGGIPIGRVVDVRIDSENTELARVDLEIRGGTPIRVDSKATLEIQGLAGGVIIQISRGSREAALLPPESEIIAGPSALEQIVRRVPDLLTQIEGIARRPERFAERRQPQGLRQCDGEFRGDHQAAGGVSLLGRRRDERRQRCG